LLPTAAPLPTYAYPLLVATFVGWIWAQWREEAPVATRAQNL